MSNKEQKAAKTPLSDLRKSALQNYEDNTKHMDAVWNSSIPQAINFYFDHLEAQEADHNRESEPNYPGLPADVDAHFGKELSVSPKPSKR